LIGRSPGTISHTLTVLGVKIIVVLIAGVTTHRHQRSSSRVGLAVFGAFSALTLLAALALGVLLAG
jgi:Na+/H+-dicarboxylate symporter